MNDYYKIGMLLALFILLCSVSQAENRERLNDINKQILKKEQERKQIQGAISNGADAAIFKSDLEQIDKDLKELKKAKRGIRIKPTKRKKKTYTRKTTKQDSKAQEFLKKMELSGQVEVKASYGTSFARQHNSDISLANANLGVDVELDTFLSAHLLMKMASNFNAVSDGYITYGNTKVSPIYLNVGKLAVPFGRYKTNLVSDTLNKELAETAETVGQLGFEYNEFKGSAYVFNGTWDRNTTRGDRVRQYGMNLGVAQKFSGWGFDFDLGYLSNLGDSNTIEGQQQNGADIRRYVPAYDIFLQVNLGRFTVIGETVVASKEFDVSDVKYQAGGAKPRAFHAEGSVDFNVFDKDITFAGGYQGTAEAVVLGLAEKRTSFALRTNIFDKSEIALEWKNEEDYGVTECADDVCGTGKKSETATIKFSTTF